MTPDLTQFTVGHRVLATLRGSIRPSADGTLGFQIEPDTGGHLIPLAQLVHVEPDWAAIRGGKR